MVAGEIGKRGGKLAEGMMERDTLSNKSRMQLGEEAIYVALVEPLSDGCHQARAEVGMRYARKRQRTLSQGKPTKAYYSVFGSNIVDIIAPRGHRSSKGKDRNNT